MYIAYTKGVVVSASARKSSSEIINLRASAEQKTLIDRAARAVGKSRTEFMLDTMREAAQNVLLDQRLYHLDAKAFAAFDAALSAPVGPSDALAKTLAARAPWDK